MKSNLTSLFVAIMCASCATKPDLKEEPIAANEEEFVATKSAIDENPNQSTIEDYIVALPHDYYEETLDLFREKVSKARKEYPENKERDRDSLFVAGSGADTSMDFLLDRSTNTLKIRVYCWEPGTTPYETTMRRVPGGWMRGTHKKLTGGYHIE